MSEIVTDPVPPVIRTSSWLALFFVRPLCTSWIVAKKMPVGGEYAVHARRAGGDDVLVDHHELLLDRIAERVAARRRFSTPR